MGTKLRIGGVPEHFNLPWKQAVDANAFDELDLTVDFIEYPGGTGAMTAALAAGELDAALLLTEGAVADILNGSDNQLVSFYVNSPLIWGIHVAADGEIRDVSEIEGRRYAISRRGSGSHLIAIVDATERGFDANDMAFEIVDSLDGARAALANGIADVFLWEKHMTQPLVDSEEFRRVGERALPWPAFVVSARRDYLAQHSALIRGALEVVGQFADRLKNGETSAELISRTYRLQLADATSWLQHVCWSTESRPPADAVARATDALRTIGAVRPDSPDATIELWHSPA